MSTDKALAELAALDGVFPEYTDMQQQVRSTSPDTQKALLSANGLDVGSDAAISDTLDAVKAQKAAAYLATDLIVRPQRPSEHILKNGPVRWSLLEEDTGVLLAEGTTEAALHLPGLPMGVHSLTLEGSAGHQACNLIVAPKRAPLLSELTNQHAIWGTVASLYAVTGERANEIGDYADLADLARVVGEQGAAFLGINPVHAIGWAAPETISPYSPTHRGFLNAAHIAPAASPDPGATARGDFLDYGRHTQVQRQLLEAEFAAFDPQASTAFTHFCAKGGGALDEFACFEAISEDHGPDWRRWPSGMSSSDLSHEQNRRKTFHKWLQWRATEQLSKASQEARDSGMTLGLYLDLAVGARLGGAESWGQGSAAAAGVALGAPPDQLSPAGQNWQLAALAPRKLQRSGYRAFRQIIASNLQHCSLLRIDHALGLNRSFWIPDDGSPGGYIRQPFDALLAIIAIEATRANALIVGEDLGLVPQGFRAQLAEAGLYGYTVMQYEKNDKGRLKSPEEMRPQSLACFGTHDTPTLYGFWQGRDIDWWRRLDWIDDAGEASARVTREQEKSDLVGGALADANEATAPAALLDHVNSVLGSAPAEMVAVQLDDMLSLVEAQNLPGTVDTHPNWRRRYPCTTRQIAQGSALKRTADIMAKQGRARRDKHSGKDGK